MRKGSPERRAFFYAIAAVIFKNKEQKCKTRSKNALQMSVFCPFLNDFSPFLCIYATKNRIFMNKNAVLVGRGGFEPPKSKTSDLQSDPFGRSGICPY